jgi:hypothetical protein
MRFAILAQLRGTLPQPRENRLAARFCLQGSHRRLKLFHYAMRRNRPWSCQGSLLAASGSYDPYRLVLRAGAAAAGRLPFRGLASHCTTGRGARSANGGFFAMLTV